MATTSPLHLILGTGNVGDTSIDCLARFDSPDEVNGYLNTWLGAVDAGKRFIIDTKVNSGQPGDHSKEKIENEINISLAALKVPQINTEYLHAPDRSTPFEETVEAIDKAYREGKFKSFGLSNYTAAEVEQIVEICERRGFIKPRVYQGQYNAVVRGGEKDLFPVLRKHGIAFYAWSPAGGGFFNLNYKNVQPGGRFDKSHFIGGMYSDLYLKPEIKAATEQAIATAAKHGINGHAAALRWTVHHSILSSSYRDAVIIGASSCAQLTSNIEYVKAGPLPEDVVTALDSLYKVSVAADGEVAYHF